VGRRQSESEVSYGVSNTFDDNAMRFSDPSMRSTYGWVSENHGVDAHVYVQFAHPTHISGIFHAGATVGSIGATRFTVKYSNSTPAVLSSFVHSAYVNTTGSNFFMSNGSNCEVDFTVFSSVYQATAVQITPLEWRVSDNIAIDAPGMRVTMELCV
jgi:hypothetical protein